jgi:hypothetical protein
VSRADAASKNSNEADAYRTSNRPLFSIASILEIDAF